MHDTAEHDPLAAAALRAGSIAAREPLARAAGGTSVRELVAALRTGMVPAELDPRRAAELAWVIAVQDLRPGDRADALAMLAALHRVGGMAPAHRGLYAQLALAAGDTDLAITLLDQGLPEPVATALRVDLGGPDWLKGFTALLPAPALSIPDGTGPRFDRIVSGTPQRIGDPQRITTIVAACEPGPALLTAVRSLVAQSWTNHEILVVGGDSAAGYDAVAALDPRVRVIRQASNRGLDVATGDYVTFCDPTGWSHPVRLERQVAPLQADPAVVATTSNGMRVTSDLRISEVGIAQIRSLNPSALMIRRQQALSRVGYPHPIGSGADREYLERIRAVFGHAATLHLDGEPLALVRRPEARRSTADDRAHRSYRSAFQAWHRHVAAGREPALGTNRVAVPRRLRGVAASDTYDVVLAGDWTAAGGAARAGVGRIRALTARGLRVAVLQLDVLAHLRHDLAILDPGLQDLINAGAVQQIELDDDARSRLVVAQSADVLSHAPEASGVRADQVVIESSTASAAAARAGRRLFGVDPVWAPPGPAGRRALTATPGGVPLAAVDLPGTVEAAAWRLDRRGPRADRPVVGRHCHGGRDEWRRWYTGLPDPGLVDIRLLDGTGAAARAFGRHGPPHGWLVYTPADVSVRNFLYQLDYYLPLPTGDQPTDPDQEVLTALAAGCVAVLPAPYAETFGESAVYCAPDETGDTVRAWHRRRTALGEQIGRGRAFVRRHHSPELYAERIATLIG